MLSIFICAACADVYLIAYYLRELHPELLRCHCWSVSAFTIDFVADIYVLLLNEFWQIHFIIREHQSEIVIIEKHRSKKHEAFERLLMQSWATPTDPRSWPKSQSRCSSASRGKFFIYAFNHRLQFVRRN